MSDELEALVAEAKSAMSQAANLRELDAVRVAFLGKQGKLSTLMKGLGALPPEERKQRGAALNEARAAIDLSLDMSHGVLAKADLNARLQAEKQDMSLPPRPIPAGSIHPINRTIEELTAIFGAMGFSAVEGPDIESDWYNFGALNIPDHHPARQDQDTFYLPGTGADGRPLVLRTQTSPLQVRTMLGQEPPIRIIAPGRTYRADHDATHSPMFHQVEGLWVGEDISFKDLKSVYLSFITSFFETDALQLRFRPSYFPFTEPSAEIDIMFESGPLQGKWLEVSGSGQVHPQVIRNMGLDPERYIGFAFGSGIDRLAMLRYGVNDLRIFFEGDVRFLSQFA
jgi:phenylalanyl-tRNA synthetase alpha chain